MGDPRRRRRRAAAACLAVVGLIALACSNPAFDRLPPADRDRYDRCFESIRAAQCGTDRDMVYTANCMRPRGDAYAREPDEATRRRYLLGQGCPPSIVNN